MTLSIMALTNMKLNIMELSNDFQHDETYHYYTRHNAIQYKEPIFDTQHKQNSPINSVPSGIMVSVIMLSVVIYLLQC